MPGEANSGRVHVCVGLVHCQLSDSSTVVCLESLSVLHPMHPAKASFDTSIRVSVLPW